MSFFKILLLLIILAPVASFAVDGDLLVEDFNGTFPGRWQEKTFSGKTDYLLVPDAEGGHSLQAVAEGTASGLVLEYPYRLQDYPFLSWRWKVAGPVPGGDARSKAGDDYSARVYVVFPGTFFFLTRSINYVWANRLPEGEIIPSAYTGRSVMVALRSGAVEAGVWQRERRNVLEDFRKIFGEEPPPVGAIAVMTDSDQTGAAVRGWYDDIVIGP